MKTFNNSVPPIFPNHLNTTSFLRGILISTNINLNTMTTSSTINYRRLNIRLSFLFSVAMLFFGCGNLLAQTITNSPCNAYRYQSGDGWRRNSESDTWKAVNLSGQASPRGVVACGSAASQDGIPVSVKGTFVASSNPTSLAANMVASGFVAPQAGQDILWFNFDIRALSGSFDFQVETGYVVAVYSSNDPAPLTSTLGLSYPVLTSVSGDCSTLVFDRAFRSETNGWQSFKTPFFQKPTNYYILIYKEKTTANTATAFSGNAINFKSRYGCGGAGNICVIETLLGKALTTQCNGINYSATATYVGNSGTWNIVDNTGEALSYSVQMKNADGIPTGAPITFTAGSSPTVTFGTADGNVIADITVSYPFGVNYDVVLVGQGTCLAGESGFFKGSALKQLETPTATLVQPTCTVATASITVNSPSGTNIRYQLDGGTVQTSNTFSGVSAGSHTITVSSINTNPIVCANSISVTINPQPQPPTTPTADVTQPTCTVPTGIITVTGPTGSGITFSIGGAYQASGTFSNLSVGTYNVTAKSSAGCISPARSVTITANPGAPAAPTTGTVTQPTCATATGSFTITNFAEANTYTFSPSGPAVNGGVVTAAAGTYTITATNAAGCISAPSADVVVNAQPATPAVPRVTTTPATCTSAGSSVVSNYAASNTYTSTPSGLSVGMGGVITGAVTGTSYTLTAANATCTSAASASFRNDAMLETPAVPRVGSVTQPTCASATGSFTITNHDATLSYSVSPSTGVTVSGANVTAPAGTYTVTARGVCPSAASANVVVNPKPACGALPGGIFHTAATCFDYINGGNGQQLGQICYKVKGNKVDNITPGQFFYYTTIVAPNTSFTVNISQTVSGANFKLFAIQQAN